MPVIKSSTPVLDDAGNPAVGRLVRAYRADTGDYLGETTTAVGGDTGALVCHMPLNFVRGSNAVADASGGVWSISGSGAIPTFDLCRWGGSSLRCNYVGGSWLQRSGAADWAFGTSDFNIQFFCRAKSAPYGPYYSPIGNWAGGFGFCFFLRPGGVIDFRIDGEVLASAPGTFAVDTDYVVDIRRVAGVCSVRLNGLEVINGALPASLTRSDFVRVGSNGVFGDVWDGWVGNVRAVAGGVFSDSNPTSAPPRPLLATGHYEIWTPYAGEVFAVCLDDAAGATYNHKIHRTAPV